MKIKHIEIEEYNPEWPSIFASEAECIKQTLQEHCLDIHHIGSTSVPGLAAKNNIDILCLVDKLSSSLVLQDMGYLFKGEYNIPMRYYFSCNSGEAKFNLHVVEANNGFIQLNLSFRDYMRSHPEAVHAYSALKEKLLEDPKSYQKNELRFSGYNLGKNHFIKEILRKSGYDGIAMNFCMHDEEWVAAKAFR